MNTSTLGTPTSALRDSLLAEGIRQASLQSLELPAGRPSPSLGRQGDVFVASPGGFNPPAEATLRSVDPGTGQERWRVGLGSVQAATPRPSADGQTVWVSSESALSAFSAATGEREGRWEQGTGDCLHPIPLSGNRAVVANWKSGRLAVLESGRPQPLWEAEVGRTFGVPAVGAGHIYASVYVGFQEAWMQGGAPAVPSGPQPQGAVQALDAATGQPLWRYESESPVTVSPVVGPDGGVYVAQEMNALVALDPATGQQRWQAPTAGRPAGAAVSPDGAQVYVADSTGALQALDSRTGEPLWKLLAQDSIQQPPAVGTEGTLCALTQDGQALLVDARRGVFTGQVQLPEEPVAPPVPAEEGSFLVWSGSGRIDRVAVADSRTGATSPSPQSGGIQVDQDRVRIGGVTLGRR